MIGKKVKNFVSLLHRKPQQDENKPAYESEQTVDLYKQQQPYIQAGEKAIMQLVEKRISSMSMLDIGVGAGRTTYFFSNRVKRYLGMDYSATMVKACKALYPSFAFEVGDVRNLAYADSSFDFLLFSFNGLDSISPADRHMALKEIYRVLAPDGYFAFCTHNLGGIDKLFQLPISFNIKKWYKVLVLRNANKGYQHFKQHNHAVILDGANGYTISNYYTTVDFQLQQLAEFGFDDVQIINMRGEVVKSEQAKREKDLWLYFLCRKSGRS